MAVLVLLLWLLVLLLLLMLLPLPVLVERSGPVVPARRDQHRKSQ